MHESNIVVRIMTIIVHLMKYGMEGIQAAKMH